jgi:hypothetical protein
MFAQGIVAKGEGEILGHELHTPSALTGITVRILIRAQQVILLALLACIYRAILAHNPAARLGREIIEANGARG